MTAQCCICKRTREEHGAWTPQAPQESKSVSHTYCPACLAESMVSITKELAQANRTRAICA